MWGLEQGFGPLLAPATLPFIPPISSNASCSGAHGKGTLWTSALRRLDTRPLAGVSRRPISLSLSFLNCRREVIFLVCLTHMTLVGNRRSQCG